jgi:NADPH:quinone reductase-like Zn-dependent oxidoreductase
MGAPTTWVLDLATHRSALAYKGSLVPRGTLSVCWRIGGDALAGAASRLLAVRSGAERLGPMVALCQAGKIATVIDRRYRLSEVPEALRYLGEGHAKGKLVAIVE